MANGWSARRARLAANSFEVWLGLASLLTSVRFLLDPDDLTQSPVGRVLHPYDYAWNVGLLLGALGILVGLWFGRGDVEVAGLSFFSGALIVQSVAAVGMFGTEAAVSLAIYAAVVTSAMARAWLIIRYRADLVSEDP